jgi:transcriptional regulator with XRE-family HTH domain
MELSLGGQIREARVRKGWTQARLAELVGVTSVAVNRYEKDLRRPDPEMLTRLAFVLEVSTDWLLGANKQEQTHDARAEYLAPTGDPRRDKSRRELLDMLLQAGRKGTKEQLEALATLAEMIVKEDEKGGDKH